MYTYSYQNNHRVLIVWYLVVLKKKFYVSKCIQYFFFYGFWWFLFAFIFVFIFSSVHCVFIFMKLYNFHHKDLQMYKCFIIYFIIVECTFLDFIWFPMYLLTFVKSEFTKKPSHDGIIGLQSMC